METLKIRINKKWYAEGETVELKRFIPFTGKRKWNVFYVSKEGEGAVLTSGKSRRVVTGRIRVCKK